MTTAAPDTLRRAPPAGGRQILGRLLVKEAGVDEEEVRSALDEQAESGERLGRILVARGVVTEDVVGRLLARQLSLPFAPEPLEPEGSALALVPAETARARMVLPLSATPRAVRLAMADPLDVEVVDDVRFGSGRRVEPVVTTRRAVIRGVAAAYGGDVGDLLDDLPGGGEEAPEEAGEQADLERAARSAPVVRLVDRILARAVRERASDVHVERDPEQLRVRFRVDGVLRSAFELPAASHRPVLSRLKIMAGLDIAVKRRPQDGGLVVRHDGRELSLRLSTLPVSDGEKAVVRILDPDRAPRTLDGLGLSPEDLFRLRRLLDAGQGVILAAGPTGSGKSSTLTAALAELDRRERNVVTLEDPVEYRLPGVSHVQVDPRAGLTFPAALRSVLRQDPDVVMVGEIRDRETAEIAMAAAVTGHLVLSTIHTTDAPGAVARLVNMGVPRYLVAGGLSGVVAQRLVRTVCRACRGRSGGCGECHQGLRGRTGVFQVLAMNDALRDAVVRDEPSTVLRTLARQGGMGSLVDDARRKVAEGITTPDQVGRVIQADPGASLPCSACGAEVPTRAVGCPRCGRRRVRLCRCGRELRRGWRFCPACLRKV